MTRYIGALDQGTTSTRFLVFDRAGETVASAQMEHRQIYPQPGWVEHDPQEIWRNTRTVIADALQRASLEQRDLARLQAVQILRPHRPTEVEQAAERIANRVVSDCSQPRLRREHCIGFVERQ